MLSSGERMGAVPVSHQADPCHPFIDKPGVLAGAEMAIAIHTARKDSMGRSRPRL